MSKGDHVRELRSMRAHHTSGSRAHVAAFILPGLLVAFPIALVDSGAKGSGILVAWIFASRHNLSQVDQAPWSAMLRLTAASSARSSAAEFSILDSASRSSCGRDRFRADVFSARAKPSGSFARARLRHVPNPRRSRSRGEAAGRLRWHAEYSGRQSPDPAHQNNTMRIAKRWPGDAIARVWGVQSCCSCEMPCRGARPTWPLAHAERSLGAVQ